MSSELVWRKSSYSNIDGGECVEVRAAADAVRVRDSKRIPGAQLSIAARSWAAFVGYVTGRET
ncbi:DUF397 domain-containing protein [Streptomyces roseoverticillatus]|uniref:DUF397 domain-containing protein n=1 Tax=Streptomyces roseoverticillatus TaxID=66429 RepID=UPI001F40DE35|nr:DUF397 domain-containing protein [Streptomyces roseoverticillatus]MCF3103443.1 DUF397 domain-containing protein [Streptomyces roseoverticillatus]